MSGTLYKHEWLQSLLPVHLRRRFETLATTVDDTSLVFTAHIWSKERSTYKIMADIGMTYIVMAGLVEEWSAYKNKVHIVMAYIGMTYIVTAGLVEGEERLYRYGLYSHGLCRYDLCSHGRSGRRSRAPTRL